jgi:hypothetical protein
MSGSEPMRRSEGKRKHQVLRKKCGGAAVGTSGSEP